MSIGRLPTTTILLRWTTHTSLVLLDIDVADVAELERLSALADGLRAMMMPQRSHSVIETHTSP
jgi:hypothetical protein